MTSAILMLPCEFPAGLMQVLANLGEMRIPDSHPARDLPNEEIMAGVDIYLTTAFDAVPAALINHFPDSIKLIASMGVGIDHIDLPAAKARGIAVSNTPVVTEDTADLAFALILATCRRLGECERLLRAGDWTAVQSISGQRVHSKTLGIIGFGAIGQAVARRAKGFGMKVIYHGPSRKVQAETELEAGYCADINTLLGEADIVSLNCSLSASTRHLVNAARLAKMKPSAVLINTGRGPLIDEQALIKALENKKIAGAGLDVFEFEPQVSPGLLNLPMVTLLPHIGGASSECQADIAMRVIANVQTFLERGEPLDRV
jgi:glyoxylate reductase